MLLAGKPTCPMIWPLCMMSTSLLPEMMPCCRHEYCALLLPANLTCTAPRMLQISLVTLATTALSLTSAPWQMTHFLCKLMICRSVLNQECVAPQNAWHFFGSAEHLYSSEADAAVMRCYTVTQVESKQCTTFSLMAQTGFPAASLRTLLPLRLVALPLTKNAGWPFWSRMPTSPPLQLRSLSFTKKVVGTGAQKRGATTACAATGAEDCGGPVAHCC